MTQLTLNQTINGFTIDNIERIHEIKGTAYHMHHDALGTELLYLDTDDAERGFAIGFKTFPADNTGVFHIIEHSTLCGSDKYPVKDPFVYLLKSSMKTFLNAMTSSNCTIYPVASTNEKDLMNLMDVYLDAVFHPAMLHDPRVFKQEGWHYESDGTQAFVNGVVYNEMKGNLAQPQQALNDALNEELFPNTSYRFEPGGVPSEIEALSYEQFIDTYKRHYTPDSAAIALYGHMDVDCFLATINDHLLRARSQDGKFATSNPNQPGSQAPVVSTKRKVIMQAQPEDASIKCGFVFADVNDTLHKHAMQILGHTLLGSNEAPLYRRLLDAGYARSFSHGTRSEGKTFFSITARESKPGSAEAFMQTLKEGCREILREGLSKDQLRASAFHIEFGKRIAMSSDQFSAAEHLMTCLRWWALGNPLSAQAICYEQDFDFLKKAIDTDYYERLLREVVLENDHYAVVELCPADDAEVVDMPSVTQTTNFDPEELERIAQEAQDLKKFQDEPDTAEALDTLPRLNRSDCLVAPHRNGYSLCERAGIPILHHEYCEPGIAHVMRYYDISGLSAEDFRYLETLIWILSQTDTLRHSAAEVEQLKDGRLGQIMAQPAIGTKKDGSLGAYAWVYTCSLADDIDFTVDYVDEVLHETVFASRSKLREMIDEQYQFKSMLVCNMAPHVAASTRAGAHISQPGVLLELFQGTDSYKFVSQLKERCADDTEADKVLRRLEILAARVFGTRPALVSAAIENNAFERYLAAEKSRIPQYEERSAKFLASLAEDELAYSQGPTLLEVEPISCGDEAFIIHSDVAYCAEAIDMSDTRHFRSKRWSIASKALSLDYLWNSVRAKGGAYDCSFHNGKTGLASFDSFSDPHIDETLEAFDKAGAWLCDADLTEEEIDGYVISAIAAFDKPSKGLDHVLSQSHEHLFGWTLEDKALEREEIASCTIEDVRVLGKELAECPGARCAVVLAGRELIEQSEHEFVVEELV